MSFQNEQKKKYDKHPNRVNLEQLQCGDFFIIIDNDRWEERFRAVNFDRPWRFEGPITYHSEYSRSAFATCIGMDRTSIAQERYGQYLWFGENPIIIKLPESQQAAWKQFYEAINYHSEAHKLRWSEWYRDNCR